VHVAVTVGILFRNVVIIGDHDWKCNTISADFTEFLYNPIEALRTKNCDTLLKFMRTADTV